MPGKPILEDSITGIWSYLSAVDWEEPWLWFLISFHVWCVVATLLAIMYNKYYPQIGLFTVYLGLAFCSEYINDWAAANYKLFSEEQYFDSQGMFVSLLFSMPLMCNALIIVGFWMWDVTQTMINLKRAKVQHTRKAAKARAELEDKDGKQETLDEPRTEPEQEKQEGDKDTETQMEADENNEAMETETKSPEEKKQD